MNEVPIGAVKIVIFGDEVIEGYGRCPNCFKITGGKLKIGEYTLRAGVLSDQAKTDIFARWLTRKHKVRCNAVLVKDYDGRFDSMTRDPITKKLVLPAHITEKDIRDMNFTSA